MEHAADAPAWLTAIQLSAPAAALRGGIWLYPLVETAHILGFAALFGGILGFDLRLIGFGRALPLDRMARLLLPVAAGGLAVALTTGALLFSVEATAYARNPAFL
ncbi:MAG TPA: hypothetical protein VEH84_03750, partial [Alphaproteobacteria bacterium]|nr:hypothetical protein [Alphaproteobacteria bacterium]